MSRSIETTGGSFFAQKSGLLAQARQAFGTELSVTLIYAYGVKAFETTQPYGWANQVLSG
jgi:hypothetical protein